MKRILLHVLFWIIMVFWISAVHDYSGKLIWQFVPFNAMRMPVIMLATYLVIYYFMPKWLIQEKQYWKFGLAFIANFLLASLIDRLIIGSELSMKLLEDTDLTYEFFNKIPILRNAFLLLSIIGLASLIRFFKLYLEEEKRKHQLEQEHLGTQLAFLKAQVNPHFLFNALNNLYSMAVQRQQSEIATGLENLSGLMHYLTYESNGHKVPLEREIELLQNYIEIQQLRFDDTDDITISFRVNGPVHGQKIAPVILLPLVENAFKHGVQAEKRSLVQIRIGVDQGGLEVVIKNTLFEKSPQTISDKGIGLENVRKRL
ncbi:MAG: histidine kinase, partial [Lewinella sp.]|nr:histidine kinase [Lewinella sp.]